MIFKLIDGTDASANGASPWDVSRFVALRQGYTIEGPTSLNTIITIPKDPQLIISDMGYWDEAWLEWELSKFGALFDFLEFHDVSRIFWEHFGSPLPGAHFVHAGDRSGVAVGIPAGRSPAGCVLEQNAGTISGVGKCPFLGILNITKTNICWILYPQ